MSKIEFEIKGIGKLIKEEKLRVPIYQRPFSWEKKQIDELHNDLKEAINNNDDEYFLGTVVLTKVEGKLKLEIVDGQQRITSIAIFFSALKQFLTSTKQKDSIQSDYLSHFEIREEENVPRLELSLQDNEFYKEFIINQKSEFSKTKESHNRIHKALDTTKQLMARLLELHNNDLSILLDWKDFIDDKLKIVVITVPSDANAYTIFETLNDRGIELAQIDLLKNYLYSKAGVRIEEAQNLWVEIVSKIESDADENLVLTYIKHHWASTHGFVREKNKELYSQIKDKVRNTTQVINFLTSLKNDLDKYLAILNHNSSFWNDYDSKCKDYIETLNYFGLEQYRPLLLSILRKFEQIEVKKALKLIVSWLVRNLIIGKLGGGTLEKAYIDKAKNITDEQIKKAKELRDNLQNLIPTNDEFKDGFKTATVSKHKLARYYLSALENHHRGKEFPELLVNTNPDAVNLEHILPQKPQDNYPNFSDNDKLTYLKRIGNLTLMKTKEKYKESELWITKSLDELPEWNVNNVIERQNKLAELAIKTWSLKFEEND